MEEHAGKCDAEQGVEMRGQASGKIGEFPDCLDPEREQTAPAIDKIRARLVRVFGEIMETREEILRAFIAK